MQKDYLERIYAGFLGKNVGIRLGAPVEPTVWTSERIAHYYGDIKGYVKPFTNFAADDDANGPVFFVRALNDGALHRKLTAQDVADAWLNYSREGVGMFWWGGYGVSTEHTAYLNLKAGISAPRSGSAEVNGKIMSEQIGGQIFIDTWGLVCPNNPRLAAAYAMTAASVSHDGDGKYGAGFIAAAISKAFGANDVNELIQAGLSVIPAQSTYAKVVNAVCDFHMKNPDNWRECLRFLQDNWGYDKYTGVCHIIPNAGVCVMSLLYGKTYARTIEIATMSGWDTDCNAGNVGTIMGVFCGIDAIEPHYREPINDSIVLSGISGYLNILDIPSYSKELAFMGSIIAGETPDAANAIRLGELYFDFELPGSTHNFRISNETDFKLSHTYDEAYSGKGSLRVLFNRITRGKSTKLFYKPFYRRNDFNDTRYSPVFSPTAYANQTVSMMLKAEREAGEGLLLTPYVRNTFTGEDVLLSGMTFNGVGWQNITFTIPDTDGAMIDEIGVIIESNSSIKNRDLGCIYLDDFSITGKADYTIDFTKQCKEFDSITPFSHNHGAWDIRGDKMEAMCLNHAEAVTGNYYMRNVEVTGSITAYTGTTHFIGARIKGALHGYYGGFSENGVVIAKNDREISVLAQHKFTWRHNKTYELKFTAIQDELTLYVDGEKLLSVKDDSNEYGMAGYAMYAMGRCGFGKMHIKEI